MVSSTTSNCVAYVGANGTSLDVTLISSMTVFLSSIWLYLWYLHPSRPMRSRERQTHWQLVAYIIMFTYGTYIMYIENMLDIFIRPTDMYTYPSFNPLHINNRMTRLLFEMEISWYLSSLLCTLVNRHASDFYAMLFHHIITPIEIYYSWTCGMQSAGLAVMVLHDVSDVFLHLAKTLKFMKLNAWTDRVFVIFMLVFFTTRLVLLPLTGLSGIQWYHPHHSTSFCHSALVHGLFVFTALHIYWFTLIVKIAIKAVKKGNVQGDVRDMSESDSEDLSDSERQRYRMNRKQKQKVKEQQQKEAEYSELNGKKEKYGHAMNGNGNGHLHSNGLNGYHENGINGSKHHVSG
jgi:hypothetical protein